MNQNSLLTKYLSENIPSFHRPYTQPLFAFNNVMTLINQFINFKTYSNTNEYYKKHIVDLHDSSKAVLYQFNECQPGQPIIFLNHAIGVENDEIWPIRDKLLANTNWCIMLNIRRGYDPEYPSMNGTFHYINHPKDMEYVLAYVRQHFNGHPIYLVGFSAGGVGNSVYNVWKQDPNLAGIICISQVHNDLHFKNPPWPISRAFNRLYRIIAYNEKQIRENQGDEVYESIMNSANFYECFVQLSKLSDVESWYETDYRNRYFINLLPESFLKTLTNEVPVVFLDGGDDPIYDQVNANEVVLPKFYNNIPNMMTVRHSYASHIGFLEGIFYGTETYSEQVIEIVSALEKWYKINK